ncbi:MAG TPA: hypothetical protein VII65_00105 [Acidimicrobiales bacterium]
MKPLRFNFAQRVVLVVGLGILFFFFGSWVTNFGSHSFTGWVGYAPLNNTSMIARFGGLHAGVRLVLWLAFTIVWMVLSLLLLRNSNEVEDDS